MTDGRVMRRLAVLLNVVGLWSCDDAKTVAADTTLVIDIVASPVPTAAGEFGMSGNLVLDRSRGGVC